MEKALVGYRFCPTGEELINYYLKNKILGKSWLVDEAIIEINICGYEPMLLPSLSKLESKDLVWYFFCRREYYTSAKKKGTKRTTPSGFWKATGVDRKIKDRRGNCVEIGIKKTLVYHEGKANKGVWTPWVMHEYHITSLPLPQRTYVICQVMYKGDDGDISYGNNTNELSHSMVSTSNTSRAFNTVPEVKQPVQEDFNGIYMDDLANPMNQHEDPSLFNPDTFFSDKLPYMHPQTPCENEYFHKLLSFNGGVYDDVVPISELIMQENHNDHRAKKPLTGIILDSSSDSDAESISETSYRGTSSPGDSDGSSNRHFHTSADEILSLSKDSCKDEQTFINGKTRESHLTRRPKPSKQEVKEGKSKAVDASMDKKSASMVKIEKKGWLITEEAMQRNHKSPPYTYLVNMIIGFILLVAVIANIISVLLSVKT